MLERNKEQIKKDMVLAQEVQWVKLNENSHKGYYGYLTLKELYVLMIEETEELYDALGLGNLDEIERETGDVMNFGVMMIAKARRMKEEQCLNK